MIKNLVILEISLKLVEQSLTKVEPRRHDSSASELPGRRDEEHNEGKHAELLNPHPICIFNLNFIGEEDPGKQEVRLGRLQEQSQEGQGHAAAAAGEFYFGLDRTFQEI